MLINPYFPYNIIFAVRHILPKLVETTAVSVGNEWYPYTTAKLLENSPLSLLAFLSGVLALGLTSRRMSVRTAVSLLLALFFGLLLFQARRFVEYFPAFALIFAAFAWTDYLESQKGAEDNERGTKNRGNRLDISHRRNLGGFKKVMPVFTLAVILIPGIFFTFKASQKSVNRSKPYDLYAEASAWLENNTPEGGRVFQTDWDDFPRLFFYNTHNTYLIGLDPTYMQLYNADLYDEWVKITKGKVKNPSDVIAGRFGSKYVISDLKHGRFLGRAEQDDDMIEVYRDEQAVIYKIK